MRNRKVSGLYTNLGKMFFKCSTIKIEWIALRESKHVFLSNTKFVLKLMKHICWLYISIDQHVHTINHVKDSCGTLIYWYMYESKFCHMCRYFEVPHDSLTWFMVWTCWSILIYNQQMCFISWSTNFVIAKRMTQWPLKKKLHNITQYLMFG